MCFNLHAFLISLIYLGGFVAIVRILVPWVLGLFGLIFAPLMKIIDILILIAVAVFVVDTVFELLNCAGGGFSFGHLFSARG